MTFDDPCSVSPKESGDSESGDERDTSSYTSTSDDETSTTSNTSDDESSSSSSSEDSSTTTTADAAEESSKPGELSADIIDQDYSGQETESRIEELVDEYWSLNRSTEFLVDGKEISLEEDETQGMILPRIFIDRSGELISDLPDLKPFKGEKKLFETLPGSAYLEMSNVVYFGRILDEGFALYEKIAPKSDTSTRVSEDTDPESKLRNYPFGKHSDIYYPTTIVVTNIRILALFTYRGQPCLLQIYVANIQSLTKFGGKKSPKATNYGIEVITKDFTKALRFVFSRAEKSLEGQRSKTYASMISAIRRESHFQIFSEISRLAHHTFTISGPGWSIYDAETYWKSVGLPETFRIDTSLNKYYKLSETYPRVLVVPSSLSSDEIVQASTFRSKGRIPILCYYHKGNGTTMTRGSQPLCGMTKNTNAFDEKYLDALRTGRKERLMIYDCRPKKNAVANRLRGGGYEKKKQYPNTEIVFLNIENIHVMRKALMLTGNNDKNEVKLVRNYSIWNFHVALLLKSSLKIANSMVNDGLNCFVHCSDGWDRTSQVCALSQIIMDSETRTIDGFLILLEKEWIRIGHKFRQRMGVSNVNFKDSQVSPIFLQFLDSTYQILMQFPTKFEFTSSLLTVINTAMRTGLFGNFGMNSELDMVRKRLNSRSFNLWSFVLERRSLFVNPLYERSEGLLIPSCALIDMVEPRYRIEDREAPSDELVFLVESVRKELREEISELRTKIGEIEASTKELSEKLEKLQE